VKLPRLLFPPVALLLTLFLPGVSQSATKAPAKAAPKSPAPASAKPAPKPTASASSKASAKAAPKSGVPASTKTVSTKKKKSTTARAPRRVTQQQPDDERTREIQRALAAKGYPVDASGVWGPQSIEALKKFQDDQNINNMSGRGKLDSLTLIALGLGPRREPPSASPSPAAQVPTEGKK